MANDQCVATHLDCDALVIGAGFSGVSVLYRLRKAGLNTKIFEAGDNFGGVWYWNQYPGARVDSEWPFYQLNIPEVWQSYSFDQRFSDFRGIRGYFEHADQVLNLRQDTVFNASVNDARWDDNAGRWNVRTVAGHTATAKYLVVATGALHHPYLPDIAGIRSFQGDLCHSTRWHEGISVRGKKVAIIGSGATGVQMVQEIAKEAGHLTVFLRRPSYCLPLGQRELSDFEQESLYNYFPLLFNGGRKSRTGLPSAPTNKKASEDTPEQREALYERIWPRGGFSFLAANYIDTAIDPDANRWAYEFWKKKVRQRFSDPEKAAIMAPDEPPYPFNGKRPPLENDYYDRLDQDNVKIISLLANPIQTFTATGIMTGDGKEHEFDMVALATGFDSYTGSLTNMGLKDKDGVDIKDKWKDGIYTYMSVFSNGFPNMFMLYGAQSPTALSNGPTLIEAQADFILDMIKTLESKGARSIECTREAEIAWKQEIYERSQIMLAKNTDSWWNAGNIPGKKKEPLIYIGGIESYEKDLRKRIDDLKGFDVVI